MKISENDYRMFKIITDAYVDGSGLPEQVEAYMIIDSDEIKKVWGLNEFLQIDEDYPTYTDRKYVYRGLEHFSNEYSGDVYEPIDYDAEEKAKKNDDDAYFCNDANFEKVDLNDYEADFEVQEFWNGSNWVEKDISVYEEVTEAFENYELLKISDNSNGQGTRHEEIHELVSPNKNHTIKLFRDVSYFQGSQNNIYIPIKQ